MRELVGCSVLLVALTGCGGDALSVDPSEAQPGFERVDSGVAPNVNPADGAIRESDAGSQRVDPTVGAEDAAVAKDPAASDAKTPTDPTNHGSDTGTPAPTSDGGTKPDTHGNDSGTPGCTSPFYLDADHDGFGDPDDALLSCTRPTGYVTDATDCYDRNALAKPGQTARFAVHRGDGSFDYDCDGVARPMSGKMASCPDLTDALCPPPSALPLPTPLVCDYDSLLQQWSVPTRGWYGNLPACGEVGLQNIQLVWSDLTHRYSCAAPDPTWLRTQDCR